MWVTERFCNFKGEELEKPRDKGENGFLFFCSSSSVFVIFFHIHTHPKVQSLSSPVKINKTKPHQKSNPVFSSHPRIITAIVIIKKTRLLYKPVPFPQNFPASQVPVLHWRGRHPKEKKKHFTKTTQKTDQTKPTHSLITLPYPSGRKNASHELHSFNVSLEFFLTPNHQSKTHFQPHPVTPPTPLPWNRSRWSSTVTPHPFHSHSSFHPWFCFIVQRISLKTHKCIYFLLQENQCVSVEKGTTVKGPNGFFVFDGKPGGRLLAVRPKLGGEPAEAGGLRHRFRPRRHGRKRRPDLRRNGLLRQGPGEPRPGDTPSRRDPGGAAVDRVRRRHDHKPPPRANLQQLQDRWRPRR